MKIGFEGSRAAEQLVTQELYAAAKDLLATPENDPTADLIYDLLCLPGIQESQARISALSLYRFCAVNFRNCLSLKLLGVYVEAEPPYKEVIRESAIRRLNVLLSDHKARGEASLPIFIIDKLAPALISCICEQDIPEDTFKILAQIVSHVAFEIFICHETNWNGLCDYISSRARSEFRKAVYVFQNLPLPLDEREFVIPLLENLCPAILNWLDPSESCVENNWFMAFTGAFCLAIHLMESERVDLAGNLAYHMLKSATELVNRGMEVGFVRRALRDMEILVRKQSMVYCPAEYRFTAGLIQRINRIEGLGKESKTVVWRIRLTLEKKTWKSVKENSKGSYDWLNRCH